MSNDLIEKQTEIISANEHGVLVPKTINDSYRLAQYFCKSRMLPARYDSPEMIMTAMQFACELKLKPLTAMRQIAVIKGTPSIYGDLPLAIALASGMVEWIKEIYVDSNSREISLANANLKSTVFAAVTQVKRKGDPEIVEGYFSTEEAHAAGLMGSDVWKKYTKLMLRYRARAQALKGKFADCLNGVAIAEYDFNDPGELYSGEEVRTSKERIKELSNILDESKEEKPVAPKIVESEVVKPPKQKEEKKIEAISGSQIKRLFDIQAEYYLPIDQVKSIVSSFGFKSSKDITKEKYDSVVKVIEEKGKEKRKLDEMALEKKKAQDEKAALANKDKPSFTLPKEEFKPQHEPAFTTDDIPW